jgi:hypothetical protein
VTQCDNEIKGCGYGNNCFFLHTGRKLSMNPASCEQVLLTLFGAELINDQICVLGVLLGGVRIGG